MNFTLAIFIVSIAAVGGFIAITIVKTIIGQQKPKAETTDRLHQMEAQIADLNRRLSNVETITTSRDFQLNQEFEQLSRQD